MCVFQPHNGCQTLLLELHPTVKGGRTGLLFCTLPASATHTRSAHQSPWGPCADLQRPKESLQTHQQRVSAGKEFGALLPLKVFEA